MYKAHIVESFNKSEYLPNMDQYQVIYKVQKSAIPFHFFCQKIIPDLRS